MKTAVIIPTYNEKSNIQDLIQAIFSLGISDLEVVVVDDNSPDGTGAVVEEIRGRDKRVHLIHRPQKMGLGTAYLDGFRYALENSAEYFVEMDADLSHDFLALPDFLHGIENCDVVVGSRYVLEGKTKNWNRTRKLVSQLGNAYARFVLNVPVRDMTTGFKCYRRKVVEFLITQNIDAVGYVFQVETTYLSYRKGFSVKEIPITFVERRTGKSKFNLSIIRESFWKVLKLKYQEWKR